MGPQTGPARTRGTGPYLGRYFGGVEGTTRERRQRRRAMSKTMSPRQVHARELLVCIDRSGLLREDRQLQKQLRRAGTLTPGSELHSGRAMYLRRACGVAADPDRIVITAGSTYTLGLISRSLARRGARTIAAASEDGLPPSAGRTCARARGSATEATGQRYPHPPAHRCRARIHRCAAVSGLAWDG
jgi:hypothetical protein